MKRLFLVIVMLFFIIIFHSPLYAKIKQSHEVVLGSLQIKEQYNFGMVFSGVQLEYRYGLQWKINKHEIIYQPKLAVAPFFCRGMLALNFKLSPINATWTMLFFQQDGHTVKGGANLITDYSYQLYPYLNGGHLFWMSETGVSPVVYYSYQWKNKRIGVSVQNSLFGFTSHTPSYEPYWFSLKAKEWIAAPHKNMKFGSYNNYNHTIISFEFVPNTSKNHSILYEFDYLGSYYGMKFSRLNHNLIWRVAL